MNENEMEEPVLDGEMGTDPALLKANEPLSIPGKIIFLILSFGLIQLIVAFNYKFSGKKKKFKDAMLFMTYGLVGWLVLLFITGSL